MASHEQTDLNRTQLAELSALADGSLDPGRRAEVESWIAASAELRTLYERERRIVELLHEAQATDRAPAGLRARIEADRPKRRAQIGRRTVYSGALAAALAVTALVLALALPGGAPGSPSVSEAAALALRGPAQLAPGPDPTEPRAQLEKGLQDVYFPNWGTSLGWRAVGQRTDRLNGRPAVTVYYQWHGKRLAYTIVGAPALEQPRAPITPLNGYELRTLRMGGRTVVTWRRAGHTCVLSARDVPVNVLLRLAAWKSAGISG